MSGHAARPQIDGLEQSNGSDEVRFHNWLIQQIAAQKKFYIDNFGPTGIIVGRG